MQSQLLEKQSKVKDTETELSKNHEPSLTNELRKH